MISDRPLGRRPFCSLWATVVLPLSFLGSGIGRASDNYLTAQISPRPAATGPDASTKLGHLATGGSFFTAETEKWGNVVNPLVSNQSEPQLGLFP
jgi:hypothetical protein